MYHIVLISDWTCYPDRPKCSQTIDIEVYWTHILSQLVASHSTIQPHGCPWAHKSQDVLKKLCWSKFLIRFKGAWPVNLQIVYFAFDKKKSHTTLISRLVSSWLRLAINFFSEGEESPTCVEACDSEWCHRKLSNYFMNSGRTHFQIHQAISPSNR